MYAKRLGSKLPINQRSPSITPLLIEALVTGKPEGKNPQDIFAKMLMEKSKKTYNAILSGWKAMPEKEKRRLYPLSKGAMREGAWKDRLEEQTQVILEYRKNIIKAKKQLIRKEFNHALDVGLINWKPSKELQKYRTLSYLVQKNIWNRLATADNVNDCCNPRAAADDSPPADPDYGIKLTKISCLENDETGHDEVYTVSVVVDGKGKIQAETSEKFSMNDGSDNVVYPNKWLYSMNNPDGYLDCAVQVWEDDGGYKEAATAIAALAVSLAAVPDVTVTKWAAIILGGIVGLTAIAGWLDDDDDFGDMTKTWTSDAQLETAVGQFSDSIINLDTGIFDFTSFHYEFQFELLSSAN